MTAVLGAMQTFDEENGHDLRVRYNPQYRTCDDDGRRNANPQIAIDILAAWDIVDHQGPDGRWILYAERRPSAVF